MEPKLLSTQALEDVYDAIAEAIDRAGAKERLGFLTRLSLTLANRVGEKEAVLAAIAAAEG
jgi:hypothetical protein